METTAHVRSLLETITYDYTSEGHGERLIHIPTLHKGESMALCGDTSAQKFFMWPTDYHSKDVMACAACQSHPDLPMILLGGV